MLRGALLQARSSTFSGNTATSKYGGAIHMNTGSEAKIFNSSVHDNTANDGGGAIYMDTGSEAKIFNSSVYDNTAEVRSQRCLSVSYCCSSHTLQDGGGIYVRLSTLTVDRCTFRSNMAQDVGTCILSFSTCINFPRPSPPFPPQTHPVLMLYMESHLTHHIRMVVESMLQEAP